MKKVKVRVRKVYPQYVEHFDPQIYRNGKWRTFSSPCHIDGVIQGFKTERSARKGAENVATGLEIELDWRD